MKNKKNYNKIFGISFLVFICFSFFSDITIAIAAYEYKNPSGRSSDICDTTLFGCNLNLRTRCYASDSDLPENSAQCVPVDACSTTPEPAICPVAQFQNITPQKDATSTGTYKLLAPIGGLTEEPKNIGDYFNKIFLIAIGLCGALAVIMIVIGGIQYMGDESIFGKTEAKSHITSAIFGLLIALGAYALLNTINPDLLGKGGVHIKQVSAEIEEENITSVGAGANVNGVLVKITPGKAATCTGGIVSIPSSMGSGQICQGLLTKLQTLKSATDTAGISWKITSSIRGGGTISSCHLSGGATSGNCADIAITSGDYSNLCVAVAQVGGLNFANEAKNTGYCQDIQPYKTYPTTTGTHLHVNLIG